jgi:hypothetical protein
VKNDVRHAGLAPEDRKISFTYKTSPHRPDNSFFSFLKEIPCQQAISSL